MEPPPPLDGQLLMDAVSRGSAATDVGGIVTRSPWAVLKPGSVDDVVRMVRFCRRHSMRVVARGQGHTTLGHAQIEGGLVIDMSSLDRIHVIRDDHAVVDAGATWRQLLEQTVHLGRRPPVLTGFQGLSVGGTLSAGGISGVSYDKGAQVDHVIELEVVTGDGRQLTCSREENAALFDAVLAGFGRCALIVRATVRLVPAPPCVRHAELSYGALGPFLHDLRELARRGCLDGVSGTISLSSERGTRYVLNALRFFTPPEQPDMARLLGGIGAEATHKTIDREHLEFTLLVDRLIDELRSVGGWERVAHPWFDVFLPDAHLERYLAETLSELDPRDDVGPPELGALGQIHLFPLWTRHLGRPLLRVPKGDLVFLFDILRAAPSGARDRDYAVRMLARNRRLFERARHIGGTRYGISAIPWSRSDEIAQLGPARVALEEQKRVFDPDGLLGAEPTGLAEILDKTTGGES